MNRDEYLIEKLEQFDRIMQKVEDIMRGNIFSSIKRIFSGVAIGIVVLFVMSVLCVLQSYIR